MTASTNPENATPLRELIAFWKSEGKRCYELAHKRNRAKPEEGVIAQSVRFWECAHQLESKLPAIDAAIQQAVAGAKDELIMRHRCGCEVCSHSAELCPATKSSIAMEQTSTDSLIEAAIEVGARWSWSADHTVPGTEKPVRPTPDSVKQEWRERQGKKEDANG